MDTLTRSVTKEIRAEMARQLLSQAELAESLGWHPRYLSRRLNDEVPLSLDDLDAIAQALDTPAVCLILPARAADRAGVS